MAKWMWVRSRSLYKSWPNRDRWTWRHALLGPAALLDGLAETLSLGFLSGLFQVKVSVWITKKYLAEAQTHTVTVNGIEHRWVDQNVVSYREMVRAAFPGVIVDRPGTVWTITYRRGLYGESGILGPGESVDIVDGMIFDVAMTGSA